MYYICSVPVGDVLIARINWGDEKVEKYREKYRQEKQKSKGAKDWFHREIKNKKRELKREKEAFDKEINKLQKKANKEIDAITNRMKNSLSLIEDKRTASNKKPSELAAMLAQRHQAAEERVAELQRQQREKEYELGALKLCYQEEKKKMEENVMSFTLRLEERDEAILRKLAAGIGSDSLVEVVQLLYQNHNVRLLGFDCGLRFLLEASTQQWRTVAERHLGMQAIQTTLNQLLPEDIRRSAHWSHDISCVEADIDLRLGRPLTTRTWDPMTTVPEKMFTFRPETADDKKTPFITSLLALPQGKLLMADYNNYGVKMTDLKSPNKVTASLELDNAPWCLAAFSPTDVAVTADPSKYIYTLNVGKNIRLVSKVKTQRKYEGISASSVEGTLIVSCNEDGDGPASVDVISRDGKLLRTIVVNKM
jgi:hypothetical protein